MRNCVLIMIAIFMCACKKDPVPETKSLRQTYLEVLSDAPLNVYCDLDHALDSHHRDLLCSSVKDEQTFAEVVFNVRDSTRLLSHLSIVSFDDEGKILSTSGPVELTKMIDDWLISSSLPDFRNLRNGMFTLRFEVRRFCYTQSTTDSKDAFSGTAGKRIQEMLEKER